VLPANDQMYPFEHNYRLGSALLGPDGDALFVGIPKNAHTSFERLLRPLGFRYTTAFRSRPVPSAVTVFAVARDPVARWQSALAEYDRSPAQQLPFAEFVHEQITRLRDGSYLPLDEHLTPQCTFLLPTMPVGRWLRFEHLSEDYAALAASLGMPAMIRHLRRGADAKSAIVRQLMTAFDAELVRQFYAGDLRLYERVQALYG
jgi:hypothetical protein